MMTIIINSLIIFLLATVIPKLILQVFTQLCPSLNEGTITPFLVWKQTRFEIAGIVFSILIAILLILYVYGVPVSILTKAFLICCRFSIFLWTKLAKQVHKK